MRPILTYLFLKSWVNRIRVTKDRENEEYVRWMFMLGEYYRGQRD
jgi:hypothetical protein